MGLTAEEITDLGRWYSVQFASPEIAKVAMDRYRRYLERQAVQP